MRIQRRLAGTSCLLAILLLLSACAGTADSTNSSLQAISLPASAELPALPGLDGQRETSANEAVPVEPGSFQLSGGTTILQNQDLLLDSSPGAASWALYSYPTGGNDIFNLTMTFTYPNGPGAWVALSNYATGRWEWKPKVLLTQAVYSVSPTVNRNYVSPQGNFYFIALSTENEDVLLTDIKVITDVPPPPTFSISGRATDENGGPLNGILIGLDVGGAMTNTDANGDYSFAGMAPGEYVLTPSSDNFNFTPSSRKVTVIDKDVTGNSFVGAPVQQAVTYVNDIAPLINGSTGEKSCLDCHIGSFPAGGLNFSTYTVVKNNADKINFQVNKSMNWMPKGFPKWSQANLDLFQDWINDGNIEQ